MVGPVCSGRSILRPFKPNVNKLKAKGDIIKLAKIAILPMDVDSHKKAVDALRDLDPVSAAKLLIYFVREAPDQDIFENLNLRLTTTGIFFRNASISLRALGAQITDVLIQSLSDKRALVRELAVAALHDVADVQSVPALIKCLLKNKHEYARKEAAKVLGSIRDEEAVDALCRGLDDKSSKVRALVASALGKIGKKSDNIIAALNKALNDSNKKVKQNVSRALKNINDKKA